MARKRYTAEEIIGQLRTIEIELGKGLAVVEACRKLGITEQLRDELLNGELFYTLHEARVIVEGWRQRYNTARPHSALGYRPLAPETRTFAPLSVLTQNPKSRPGGA
jgi:transposase InsO family protein